MSTLYLYSGPAEPPLDDSLGGWLSVIQGGDQMANFAIMRCVKLKTMGSLASSLQHCYRERETLNADAERTPTNIHELASSTNEAMGKIKERLPGKRRKDAVLAVEYLMTASPEWWATASNTQKDDFFINANKWLIAKYGNENIIVSSIHLDEKTPHLSAYVTPVTQDGRLSAKEFIGNKKQMSLDQTSFYEAVKHLNLERGLEGSKATHQRVKSYYGAIKDPQTKIPLLQEYELKPRKLKPEGLLERVVGVSESREGVVGRINQKLIREVTPIVEIASTAVLDRRKANSVQNTAIKQQQQLQTYKKIFDGLDSKQIEALVKTARQLAEQNKKELKRSQEEQIMQRELNKKQDRGFSR